MQYSHLLLLAAGVAAFTVPKGQPDGVYEVTTAADGTETHKFLGRVENITLPATDGSAPLARSLPGASVGCGGYMLNHQDTHNAVVALDRQCGGGASVGKGKDFYSLSHCTVAYFCNLSGGSVSCFASERQETGRDIDRICGAWQAGWEHTVSVGRTAQYGIEDNCGAGRHFCGRGV